MRFLSSGRGLSRPLRYTSSSRWSRSPSSRAICDRYYHTLYHYISSYIISVIDIIIYMTLGAQLVEVWTRAKPICALSRWQCWLCQVIIGWCLFGSDDQGDGDHDDLRYYDVIVLMICFRYDMCEFYFLSFRYREPNTELVVGEVTFIFLPVTFIFTIVTIFLVIINISIIIVATFIDLGIIINMVLFKRWPASTWQGSLVSQTYLQWSSVR